MSMILLLWHLSYQGYYYYRVVVLHIFEKLSHIKLKVALGFI